MQIRLYTNNIFLFKIKSTSFYFGGGTDEKYGHCKIFSAWDSGITETSEDVACSASSGYEIWNRIKKAEGILDFTGVGSSFLINYPLEYKQGEIYVIDFRLNNESILNSGDYGGKVYYDENAIHFTVNKALGGSSNRYILFYRVVA